jgi:hypothetical protein
LVTSAEGRRSAGAKVPLGPEDFGTAFATSFSDPSTSDLGPYTEAPAGLGEPAFSFSTHLGTGAAPDSTIFSEAQPVPHESTNESLEKGLRTIIKYNKQAASNKRPTNIQALDLSISYLYKYKKQNSMTWR